MFVGQVLQQYLSEEPVVMLDLCAAPGGKSTHACSLLPAGSLLVANEVIRNRSQILAENLTKWGYPGVVVTNNDPADFSRLGVFFDVILTDVPCSGEGMFRKDPRAIEEWSSDNVEICWQRQRRIIADIWQCLKPGGILIYSTCTYNTKEDEENVRWICDEFGAEVLPLDISSEWNITGNLLAGTDFPVYRFLPHKTKGEGFFLAVLRKPEGEKEMYGAAGSESFAYEAGNGKATRKKVSVMRGKAAPSAIGKEQLTAAKSWLAVPEAYELSANGNTITAFPKEYIGELAILQQFLRIGLCILIHLQIPVSDRNERESHLVKLPKPVVRDIPSKHVIPDLIIFRPFCLPVFCRPFTKRRNLKAMCLDHFLHMSDFCIDH